MLRDRRFQHRLLALVASLLLFAQIMGLHRHMHSDAAAHGVQSELHFGDAGLHDEVAAHTHAIEGGAAITHEHHAGADVEVSALGDALGKYWTNLLPAGLLAAAFFLLVLPPVSRMAPPRPVGLAVRRHPFSLHPPANGPPRRHSSAD